MELGSLGWIVVSGVGMSLLALSGGVVLILTRESFARLVMPLVALAGGSLLGGALFHMLPRAVATLGNELSVYAWMAAGVMSFFVLEQFLHWHHCHRAACSHGPLGTLILVADGLHNLIGGLAVGAAFVVDVRLGVVTWLVAAAHEIPQEMGDLGILVHSGWTPRAALAYNMASALTFLVGGVAAWVASDSVETAVLLPFAAGNFLYIALADLVPELTTPRSPNEKGILTGGFAAGLVILRALATVG